MGVLRCLPRVLGSIPMGVSEASPRPLGIISKTLEPYPHDPCESLPTPLAAIRKTHGKHPDRGEDTQAPYLLLYKEKVVWVLRE